MLYHMLKIYYVDIILDSFLKLFDVYIWIIGLKLQTYEYLANLGTRSLNKFSQLIFIKILVHITATTIHVTTDSTFILLYKCFHHINILFSIRTPLPCFCLWPSWWLKESYFKNILSKPQNIYSKNWTLKKYSNLNYDNFKNTRCMFLPLRHNTDHTFWELDSWQVFDVHVIVVDDLCKLSSLHHLLKHPHPNLCVKLISLGQHIVPNNFGNCRTPATRKVTMVSMKHTTFQY